MIVGLSKYVIFITNRLVTGYIMFGNVTQDVQDIIYIMQLSCYWL